MKVAEISKQKDKEAELVRRLEMENQEALDRDLETLHTINRTFASLCHDALLRKSKFLQPSLIACREYIFGAKNSLLAYFY